MTALAARGIRKSYGRRQVLAGLDLEIMAGDLVAVVGENGTGKTTLLRILAGDLRPDGGSVAVRGRPGYCPQAVVLDEALTVDQHVRYFQAAYRIGRTGRAEELIERLGYAACRGQRAGTLSGGTRQKLSLTLPGFRLADLPRLLGPHERAEAKRDRDRGHQPPGIRAGTLRPDLPPERRADR
jgi:ABC-2 type transport system ATP-binding protein